MSTPATPTSCDILVFGGTGDLALHKLLPALYRLHREDRLPADTRIFALARSALDNAAFLALAERNVRAVVARSEFAAEQWKGFAARLDYLAMDASQSADFGRLARHLKSSEGRVLVHYLATSPSLFAPIAQNLSIAGLAGRKRASCWKNRWAIRWTRRGRSTSPSVGCSTSRGCSASTTTWARKPCRT